MKTTIQIFEYEGSQIEFNLWQSNIMINATEMAKIYNARISDFFENDNTKNFIKACLNNGNSRYLSIEKEADLYVSKQRTGTWMHRILALKFAAWLDPSFELWVYFTIDKILFGTMREDAKVKFDIQARKEELRSKFSENPEYLELMKLEDLDKTTDKKIRKQQNAQFDILLKAHSN